MKKLTHLFLFCFLTSCFLSLASNLSAQSGWSEDQRLVFMQGAGWYPRAACSGDTIHLVWWQAYIAHDEIFYKRSTDAGLTWEEDVMLSIEDDRSSVLPWIAVNGNYVHVVWQQHDVGICYRKSSDVGNSWLPIDTIPNGGSGNPSICVADSSVYVVAYRTDGKIIFSKSTDNGNSWLPSQEINFDIANKPRIENIDSNQYFLILSCENLTYSVEIYYIKSTDAGETWSDSQCVSQYDSISGQRPAMDVDDSSGIHITWYDYKYSPYPWTGDIFYRASRDSGNTWEEIDSLTIMHRAVASDILAEGNNLHLAWEDDRHGFNNNFEIYYRMSTDLGQTWENEVRLTDAPEWSRMPSLACGNKFLHLFWSDQRDDPVNRTDEIYYKRKDLTGIDETKNYRFISTGLSLSCATILRGSSLIHYDLGSCKNGDIMIMDVTGRVLNKFPVHQVSGYFELGSNKEVCGGVYFIMLQAEEEYTTKKVVVVK